MRVENGGSLLGGLGSSGANGRGQLEKHSEQNSRGKAYGNGRVGGKAMERVDGSICVVSDGSGKEEGREAL